MLEQADRNDDTIIARPLPKRPETGLQAWLATIGYIGSEYSPDAMLTLRITPKDKALQWSAVASWGEENIAVHNWQTMGEALSDLWKSVSREHKIFKTLEAATRRPANFPADRWVDPETQVMLDRLMLVTEMVFGQEWLLIIVYHAVDNPTLRVQARLLANQNQVHIGGSGASILEACQDVYRNAAPGYFASAIQKLDNNPL